jgi:hypothetical protein
MSSLFIIYFGLQTFEEFLIDFYAFYLNFYAFSTSYIRLKMDLYAFNKSIKVYDHEAIATKGKFFMVVELLERKKKRERGGRGEGKERGEREENERKKGE